MKAYKIDWADGGRNGMVLDYRFHLPHVNCTACGDTWGDANVEYPAFNFDFLNKAEYNDDRRVSLEEFAGINARIARAIGRPIQLSPGACIGRPYGTAYRRTFDDFDWGRLGVPQISKRANERLVAEGIHLLTAELDVKYRGKPITSHLAIQVESVPMLTGASLRRHASIIHCPVCGSYYVNTGRPICPPEGYQINAAAWPAGQHLVQMTDTGRVLASGEFMAAVEKHHLTGITFVECGEYVDEPAPAAGGMVLATGGAQPGPHPWAQGLELRRPREVVSVAGLLKKALAKGSDPQAARAAALQVARLLGSKVKPNSEVVIGETYCPFRIPLHTDLFWCFVSVSEKAFQFSAQSRSKQPSVVFFVSLKVPADYMHATIRLAGASGAVGVDVFGQRGCPDEHGESPLASEQARSILQKIDFGPIRRFEFSPVQMRAESSFASPVLCADQALVFRELMTVVYQEAMERSRRVAPLATPSTR